MINNVVEITGNGINPMWDKIVKDDAFTEKSKNYHCQLEKDGYKVLGANQVKKDNILFWIIWDDSFNFSLEKYGILKNREV